jgi:hypothetical protein
VNWSSPWFSLANDSISHITFLGRISADQKEKPVYGGIIFVPEIKVTRDAITIDNKEKWQ